MQEGRAQELANYASYVITASSDFASPGEVVEQYSHKFAALLLQISRPPDTNAFGPNGKPPIHLCRMAFYGYVDQGSLGRNNIDVAL